MRFNLASFRHRKNAPCSWPGEDMHSINETRVNMNNHKAGKHFYFFVPFVLEYLLCSVHCADCM